MGDTPEQAGLSFNRTFMELKYGIETYLSVKFCFNRTFMELK